MSHNLQLVDNIILLYLDVPMEKVVLLRKVAVTVSIISGTLALHFHGYQSMLLPHWPLVFLCAWSVLGLALSKNQKVIAYRQYKPVLGVHN